MADPPGVPAVTATPGARAAAGERLAARAAGKVEAQGIASRAAGSATPLSFAQERLWFFDQLHPASAVYNMPFAMRIAASLSPVVLERTIAAIVARHETLRTSFVLDGSTPVQRIAASMATPFETIDLRGLDPVTREQRAQAIAAHEAEQPFDLGSAPLLRVRLVRLADDDHLLLITLHHIVSDGWSMGVLYRELGQIYAAFAEGKSSPLTPLPIQYADFAAWQREQLREPTLDTLLGFWRDQLDGAAPVLDLPFDRPRPAAQSYRGGLHSFAIDPATGNAVRTLARQLGATPFMVLLAAFNVLLARYSGQDDIVVGTPIANRTQVEQELLIGFFVNTLVIRSRIGGDVSFRDLVAQTRETLLAAYAHQDLPFERLVEELQPQRSLSHNPLFQVLFALQSDGEAGGVDDPPRGQAASDAPRNGMARFDLALAMREAGSGFSAVFEFARDLFDDATIAAMAERFVILLRAAVADPDTPVRGLPLMTAEQRRWLTDGWNRPLHPYAPDLPFPDLVMAIAATQGAAPAVDDGQTRLDYATLAQRARAIAAALAERGIGAEDPVGVCLGPDVDLVTAFLGILSAGAMWVPLALDLPCARLALLARDAGLKIVIGRADDGHDWIPNDIAFLDIRTACTQGATAPPCPALRPESAAYLIYTSGSTGTPKGVVVPHAALARVVFNQRMLFGLTPQDRVLLFASIAFDASVYEMVLALSAGACVHLAPPEARAAGTALGGLLRSRRITAAVLPPAVCAVTPDDDLPDLRLLLTAGEAIEPAVARRWAVGRRYYNGYGPTEAGIWASTGGLDVAGASVPIGVPCINTRLYVLDHDGEPVPPGIAGELHIGGEGIARGYRDRPDLTAERFIADPFALRPGARMYRSGDLVRLRHDGQLDFLGRVDAQLKIRGFRIEPGEIEAALCAIDTVAAAAVVARGTGATRRIEAHVVAADGHAIDAETLRAELRRTLPGHMVPSAIHPHARLPLTRNGKVDHAALTVGDAPTTIEARPRSATEVEIAALWCEVIEVDAVPVDQSFFDIGGHSLLATRLVMRLRDRFGVTLPLRAIFETPSVAGQAGLIERARHPVADVPIEVDPAAIARMTEVEKRALLVKLLGGGDAAPAPVRAVERNAPLSFAQERLWFFDQLHPASALYNMPFAMRIAAPLSPDLLERTIAEIVARHETLRTSFALDGSTPMQRIAASVATPFEAIDLRALDPAAREAKTQALAAHEAERPFDLATAPLLRVRLVRLADDDQLLLITLHHIISDGWSMGVLYRELGQIYAAFAEGKPSPLAPLPIQYADFAAWQRTQLQGPTLDALLGFWRDQLDGAPPVLDLPFDRPRPAAQSYRGGLHSFALDPATGNAVRALARAHGATPFMVLLAAVNVLLARYSGQDDIIVGTPIANRTQVEQEQLIGFFVNTLVIRSRVGGAASFRDLVAQTRETLLAAYAHQDLPFERLVEELQPQRSLSHNPLFQVMVLYQAATGKQDEQAPPTTEGRAPEALTGTSKFDLTIALAEVGGGLSGAIEYNSDLFAPDTIARFAGHFATLLRAALADPDQPPHAIGMIDPPERARLLGGMAPLDAAPIAIGDATIDRIVARVADTAPDRPALDFADGTLSYGELDAQSNRLARALRKRGVDAGDRVGLCLERSAALVVAMLATWKIGASFVTLDVRNPPERIAAMLGDAGVSIVLSAGADSPAGEIERFDLVAQAGAIARRSAKPLPPVAHPADVAQILFTSGSTGAPKGVMLEHRQLLWFLDAMRDAAIAPDDRVAQCANPAFDVMAFECWSALTAGACLVGIPRDALLAPDTLAATIAGRRVTVLYQTAALFNQVAAHRPDAYRGVRLLLVGGDVVEPSKVRAAMLASGIALFKHTYGPTETTIFCSIQTLTDPPAEGDTLSLAPALPGATLYLVDAAGQLAPEGVPGEIWIGGQCLARGYVGRPDLTADRFVPDPFGSDGGRLYRSGDMARLRSDGALEFLGRRDGQVKLRGYRIEPAEIDLVLRGHPGVSDAVTLCRGAGVERQLVSYVVADAATAPPADALRRRCKQALPDYMVPAHIVRLDRLPLTMNGKLDRAALPLPERNVATDAPERDAPASEIERAVAAIWCRVLGLGQVARDDNFFDIGGHSLLATQVVTRLREELGADLTLRTIFEAPTLAELAAATEQGRADPLADDSPPDEPPLVRVSRAAYRVRATPQHGAVE